MTDDKMPRYRSHKIVHALEIKSVTGAWPIHIDYADEGYEDVVFNVPHEMITRYKPVAGDFHVFYGDGYASFSPRKAFLEGYSRDEPNAFELGAAARQAGIA